MRLGAVIMICVLAVLIYLPADESKRARRHLGVLLPNTPQYIEAARRTRVSFAKNHPNVELDIQLASFDSWSDYVNGVFRQVVTGDEPDVLVMAIEGFAAIADEGLLMDLEGQLPPDSKAQQILADVAPNLLNRIRSKCTGELNYFPLEWNSIVIYYNKDLFDRAGIAYPKDSWTWEEFLATAKALTVEGDETTQQFGYVVPGYHFGLTPWFLSNDTGILDEGWRESNVLDQKFSSALEFLYDLVHVHGVSPAYSQGTRQELFLDGRVAMFSSGHWSVPVLQKSAVSNVGVVLPPSNVGRKDTVYGIGGIGIFKSSEQPELALEFIKEFAGDEFGRQISESGLAIPPTRARGTSASFTEYPDNGELFYETAEFASAVPSPPNFAIVEDISMRHIGQYLTSNIGRDEAMQALDVELNRMLTRDALLRPACNNASMRIEE